jgi:hypothetical protein
MNYKVMLAITLAVTCLALAAPASRSADTAEPTPPPVVIVDPGDLRQPVPDPEQGLTTKYDGQLVRFTGVVRRSAIDQKRDEHSADLEFDIVQRLKIKGKDTVVGTDKIVVMVTFKKVEKTLHQLFEKEQRQKGPGIHFTVQGKGSITTDGSLVITDAVIVR